MEIRYKVILFVFIPLIIATLFDIYSYNKFVTELTDSRDTAALVLNGVDTAGNLALLSASIETSVFRIGVLLDNKTAVEAEVAESRVLRLERLSELENLKRLENKTAGLRAELAVPPADLPGLEAAIAAQDRWIDGLYAEIGAGTASREKMDMEFGPLSKAVQESGYGYLKDELAEYGAAREATTDVLSLGLEEFRVSGAVSYFYFFVVILYFIYELLMPMERITGTIEEISRGRLDLDVKGKERKDEVGRLARAFDRTLVSLKMAIKETAPELKMESQALKRALAEKEEAMAAMRESEETLRSVMQADPDIVIVADPEGKIKFINHTVAEHSPGKIVGTSVYDYVAEGFHGVLEESFKTVMRTGKTGSYEISGPGLKGTARRYETRVVPITRKGKVTELILIARDIGAEKGAGSERKG